MITPSCPRPALYIAWSLALLVGCGDKSGDGSDTAEATDAPADDPGISLPDDDTDTPTPTDTGESSGDDDCEELALEINGETVANTPDPRVGDTWRVFLQCDGVNLHGANILSFNPPSLATVEDVNTIATFVSTGIGIMHMQSGNRVLEIDIQVLEASP